LSVKGTPTVLLYCSLSFVSSLIAFLAFRVSDGISRYFSVHDAIRVINAIIASGLTTTMVLFTFTRLEGIPRPHGDGGVLRGRRATQSSTPAPFLVAVRLDLCPSGPSVYDWPGATDRGITLIRLTSRKTLAAS